MKKLFIGVVSMLLNPSEYLRFGNHVILSRLSIEKGNKKDISHTEIKKSTIRVHGLKNVVQISDAEVYNTRIDICGENNALIVESGVKLYNMHLQIRSNNNLIHIGSWTSFGGGNIISESEANSIKIGEDCMIADFVDIWNSDTHKIYSENGGLSNTGRPIIIGNHVWVGKDVAILKGVSIGDGAVIGMKSVVTNDVDSSSLYAGIPARKIKKGIKWER